MTIAGLVLLVVAPALWLLAQLVLAARAVLRRGAPAGARLAGALPPWTPVAAWRAGYGRAWVVAWFVALAAYGAGWALLAAAP